MNILAQVKNGDDQFWNIEISCSQWEGSACTQSALILFILQLFPTCSFQVPNKFHIGSQCVLQGGMHLAVHRIFLRIAKRLSFKFFFCNGPIKLAHCPKKTVRLLIGCMENCIPKILPLFLVLTNTPS